MTYEEQVTKIQERLKVWKEQEEYAMAEGNEPAIYYAMGCVGALENALAILGEPRE